jgi:hypothetical protein
MEKAAEPEPAGTDRRRSAKKAGRLTVDEERVIAADVPAGSRFEGYEDFLVQDLVLRSHVVRLHYERWLTPDGRTVAAPMPAGVIGHFGPALLLRFVLPQCHQDQVTIPRLVAELRAIGVAISSARLRTPSRCRWPAPVSSALIRPAVPSPACSASRLIEGGSCPRSAAGRAGARAS